MKIKDAVRLAIANATNEDLTDIQMLERPFELDLIDGRVKRDLADMIEDAITSHRLPKLAPLTHVFSPGKIRTGGVCTLRRAAAIHPYDAIFYLALVLTYAEEIEKQRLPKRDKQVFSYRFKSNQSKGQLFDPNYSWEYFKQHAKALRAKNKHRFLVKTDMASFYDKLNHHYLLAALRDIPGIPEEKIKLTDDLLSSWSGNASYGLPVGGNASRILAEVALIGVDKLLKSEEIPFCRYVDDYWFHAPDAWTAQKRLETFAKVLSAEGLNVNWHKTKIHGGSSHRSTAAAASSNKINLGKPSLTSTKYTRSVRQSFSEQTPDQIEEAKKLDIQECYGKISASDTADENDVLEYLSAIAAQGKFNALKYSTIVEKLPAGIPLLVDFLIKHAQHIPVDLSEQIRNDFAKMLDKHANYPEYMTVPIAKLLGQQKFRDAPLLLKVFKSTRRDSGDYLGRAILDALSTSIKRDELLEVKPFYSNASVWEKSTITHMVTKVTGKPERDSWIKSKSSTSSLGDDFALWAAIASRKTGPKSKRKGKRT